MRVLVIGSGAREHAIVWKCARSKLVDRLFCAPANAGIDQIAKRVDIAADDIEGLVAFARDYKIDLTIVGPELPLTLGIVDRFQDDGLLILGPSKDAALIEGSKVFAKNVLDSCGLKHATAQFELFAFPDNAKKYIEWYMGKFGLPLVVKANGLAAGKGVVVAKTVEEGFAAVDRLMIQEGHRLILIEEYLLGWECSFTVLTDGRNILLFPVSRDYKQDLYGNNTGGVGSFAPLMLSQKLYREIYGYIHKALDALRDMGRTYKGFLYPGMIVTSTGPKFLEFNCRLGDPEAQVVLPLLKSDFVDLCYATAKGDMLKTNEYVRWHDGAFVNVVLCTEGYPGEPKIGHRIYGLEKCKGLIFQGGTRLDERGNLVTAGGRVLSIVGHGQTLEEARENAYADASNISFKKRDPRKGTQWHRDDIASGA